jgi:MOSC domain-containing protein YiiM
VIGSVAHLHRSESHSFSKHHVDELVLLAGMGVEGDVHCGATVKHRSRVTDAAAPPNLRQVHLMPQELHDELRDAGFAAGPGDLGENITTTGLDLVALPTGTVLRIGDGALIALTGLRNPCLQIDKFERGVLKKVMTRDADGNVVLRAGVMAVVVLGGTIRCGDHIDVALPPEPRTPLDLV